MIDTFVSSLSSTGGFALACPVCRARVEVHDDRACCTACGAEYPCVGGIWHFLPPARAAYYQPFLEQYACVRLDEGWGSPSSEYYRLLPWVMPGDSQQAVWSLRRQHFQSFIQKVVQPLEKLRRRSLTILDLGAGNGWLSNRLSERGHRVAAVDIHLDPLDGLGAVSRYPTQHQFLALQAEFTRLPLVPAQVDLVIYNGSLHYSIDYHASLSEALRVLKADGQLVIMDSPFYEDPAGGREMAHERQAHFADRYGFTSEALDSMNFLTRMELDEMGSALGYSWRAVWPIPAWRRTARRLRGRLIARRETAQFPIIQIKPSPQWDVPLARRVMRRLWEPFLRWRYRLIDQPRSRKAHLEKVNGDLLMMSPGVFNPRLFYSGAYFARQLTNRLIPPGCRVLDLGTGTGIGAIHAARWAGQVMAVDINPAAVQCARANVRLHQLEGCIEVRQGDLYAAIASERFDVVLFNPPFLRGDAAGVFECSFFSNDVAERFAGGLPNHLTAGGHALLLLSSLGDTASFLQALRWQGFRARIVAQHDWVAERFTLYQVTPDTELKPYTTRPVQSEVSRSQVIQNEVTR